MSFRSFFASFKPSVAAEMAKMRSAKRAAAANPHANRPGDPTESTFLGAFREGAKKVAAAIAPASQAGKDYRTGYSDDAAAPRSRGPWTRPPGAQYPTTTPVISVATGEVVSPPVAVPPVTVSPQQAAAKQQAELSAFARSIPVPGLAPVIAVGEAISSAFGISPTFVWPDNFDPYTGDGTPFHGGISLWDSAAPVGKVFGASGIIVQPGETIRHAALRNQLTYWQQQGHPLTTTQQRWLSENSGAPEAPAPSLVVRAPTPFAVAIPDSPKAADPAPSSNPYGLTDAQVATIKASASNPLIGNIWRGKYPLLFR